MNKNTLTQDEKELIHSFDQGEWKAIKNEKSEMSKLTQYARNTLQKDKRINIRLSARDLGGIQSRAVEEGMPYQTLIASVLHKYVSGRLIEKRRA